MSEQIKNPSMEKWRRDYKKYWPIEKAAMDAWFERYKFKNWQIKTILKILA